MKLAGLLFAITLLSASAAQAETLFLDDFQDGNADGWGAAGSGDVRLSKYYDNVSLKLTGKASATAQVSTSGFINVTVTFSFAASALGTGDACIGEVSADGGTNWTELYRVVRGQDDAVTLHSGSGTAPGLDNNPRILVRLRAGNSAGATCWADNIKVAGRKQVTNIPSVFDAGGARTLLAFDDLMRGKAALTDFSAFALPANALAVSNRFEGRLTLGTERPGSGFHMLRDVYGDSDTHHMAARHLPPFDFSFVQSGNVLIPVQRGAIPGAHPEWEYILEPGRVWNEAGDKGFSRASLPFTLEERNANCMHNGVLTFLFKSDGSVSDVAYQIASETCIYFKFDMWGRMEARYTPSALPSAAAIADAYKREIADRLPTKPVAELAKDHPGIDPSNFGSPSEIDPDDMTVFGVVANGVNYVGSCETRAGTYPYCAELDLPSYSLAKSIYVGISTMRLALLHPDILSQKIADYVPECLAAKSWGDVTFANALDMATGHYNSTADQADEDAPDIAPFFAKDNHAGKIDFACTHYPRKSAPGVQWVYHSADTYALGTALRAYYAKTSSNEFYRDVLVDPLWHPLHLNPAIDVTRRTYDDVRQPYAGFGLTLHRDDVAKIADFLSVDEGKIGTTAMLDHAQLMAALQRDPNDRGLRASTDDFRYNNGFWAWNAQTYLGCKNPTWIPFMSGFGGIAVALMPNGITYYYFSDSGTWRWGLAAAEANKIKPFCEK